MVTARLIERRFHNVPGKLRVSELFFDVPVDYSKPADGSIRLFARSARHTLAQTEKDDRQLPWLVYLTGGPGFGCQQPQDYPWIRSVLDKGYQVSNVCFSHCCLDERKVLFLDQRGTGMSSTITAATLAPKGNAFKQAEYLQHFRADSIVRDCEAIRQYLTADYPEDIRKWSILGQSFGGFCAVTYLSKSPEGLKEVFIAGGLPPLVRGPDPVYQRTYFKVEERNKAYYAKFPEDAERVKKILGHLKSKKVRLPSDGTLTPRRFQQLGIFLGMHGGLDTIHDIVLRSINDLDVFGFLTRPTLSIIDSYGGFDNHIIYAVLHEAIYCQGQTSQWSAGRIRGVLPRFQLDEHQSQVFFTGEMVTF
ncbi:hypothetical protein Egran_03224 [Elaphomyces granulatus]|uniref:AB hydrolase-1 domain-containing protein n=1 Tax=Elaphomyces granulatus TaxID=519963 RepID=A0A232LXY4_9EURO|nr:hypothetical protein Egran_03224 [Elaphomyces granulatus]